MQRSCKLLMEIAVLVNSVTNNRAKTTHLAVKRLHRLHQGDALKRG